MEFLNGNVWRRQTTSECAPKWDRTEGREQGERENMEMTKRINKGHRIKESEMPMNNPPGHILARRMSKSIRFQRASSINHRDCALTPNKGEQKCIKFAQHLWAFFRSLPTRCCIRLLLSSLIGCWIFFVFDRPINWFFDLANSAKCV